ncbi:MAG: hypothetical protein KDK70_35550, partial [Myxococcales bacterium]|nr:hypothetical protein [Myxococcales bacterium]
MTRPLLPTSMLVLPVLAAAGCFEATPPNSNDTTGTEDGDSTETGQTTPTSGSTTAVDTSMTGPDVTTDPDTTDSGGSVCGDGRVTGDEACDDGVNDGSYGGCAPDCSALGPYCGDGEANGDEVCDDGNAEAGDGCNPDCIASGTQLWCQTFDGAAMGIDAGNDVAIGPDDSIVVVGYEGTGGMSTMAWIRQYDAAGTTQWTETWMGAGLTTARAVDVGGSGEVVVSGSTTGDIFVLGYSPQGDLSWERTVTSGVALPFSGGYGVAVDEAGDAFVIGQLDQPDGRNIWIRRYDVNGNEQWTDIVGMGGGTDLGRGIAILGEELVVAGRIQGNTTWVRRYDPAGAQVWTETDVVGHIPVDVALDPDGKVLIAGGSEIWLRKYDPNGNTAWTET